MRDIRIIFSVLCGVVLSIQGNWITSTSSNAEPLLVQDEIQEVEPNNRDALAQGLPIPATATGSIGGGDVFDLFSIQTTRIGRLTVTLTLDKPEVISVSLRTIFNGGGGSSVFSRTLRAGTRISQQLNTLPAGAFILTLQIDAKAPALRYTLQLEGSEGLLSDTKPPTITLLSPNGGEIIKPGSTFRIEWTSDDALSDRIHDEIEPNDTPEEATALISPVRILGHASQTDQGTIVVDLGEISDVIEDLYTISPKRPTTVRLSFADDSADFDLYSFRITDGESPRIIDSSTNIGPQDEMLMINDPTTILLGVTAFEGVSDYTLEVVRDNDNRIDSGGAIIGSDILLSVDGGMTYTSMVEQGIGPGAIQHFQWKVPSRFTASQARLRVVARDGAGNTSFDDSDGDFKVMP